ncbi:hypothetical protein MAXJ12_13051 [Mesorhizobium alhagi CCNWXJ12-2]|uniref:Uncharacterized protein n=1 Tax=Mesorhizobium alhagi CCNWXJ12-2 TaxID=1107882 RepID=H0HR27_9HYPH|nr:hypothetical protein MAXJ12_13051 [Mesorhizobium alhagi CCNWXJ12-2]
MFLLATLKKCAFKQPGSGTRDQKPLAKIERPITKLRDSDGSPPIKALPRQDKALPTRYA